jgi:hypothetical protein
MALAGTGQRLRCTFRLLRRYRGFRLELKLLSIRLKMHLKVMKFIKGFRKCLDFGFGKCLGSDFERFVLEKLLIEILYFQPVFMKVYRALPHHYQKVLLQSLT